MCHIRHADVAIFGVQRSGSHSSLCHHLSEPIRMKRLSSLSRCIDTVLRRQQTPNPSDIARYCDRTSGEDDEIVLIFRKRDPNPPQI